MTKEGLIQAVMKATKMETRKAAQAATEAVFEDLRTRYFLAKQAVRDFRADVQ